MLRYSVGISAVLVLLLSIACKDTPRGTSTSSKQMATSRMLTIHPDVTLEVVDWGGEGTPMVFLAGLGHTAHVFEEIAPLFADNYHVIGITRRGFGASSQPEDGYDIGTLADDIRLVLDSLRFRRVILVGHSLGGDEITNFAVADPDRVAAAIYLDAAYDRTTTNDSMAVFPVPDIEWPEPSEQELATAEGYRRFYERSNGVLMPLKEIKEIYNWNDDGSFAGSRTSGSIYGLIQESLTDPVYEGITIPALAVYGVDYPIQELFPDFAGADSADQVLMNDYYEANKRMAAKSRQRFRDQMKNGTVVELAGAGHSLYITHPKQVDSAMRRFLETVVN